MGFAPKAPGVDLAGRIKDIAVIAPDGHAGAAAVAAWLDAQGVAHVRVRSVDGSPLVVRAGQATFSGMPEVILHDLQDLLWRDLQS